MAINRTNIEIMLKSGTAFIVNTSNYSDTNLKLMAKVAIDNNTHLTIRVDSKISATALKTIAKNGKTNITIDLSLL